MTFEQAFKLTRFCKTKTTVKSKSSSNANTVKQTLEPPEANPRTTEAEQERMEANFERVRENGAT
ncbi:hypothetical protein CCACVL1_18813 [Corchorus capsularis]|uniref:Uncharacterized protein n=1 Tax=Corchorus capsularis TaxID=210143 RepID=A0A1R3HK01_COCAP|nr:hypothetical protein CCACVL1_18813 [Corchorus capsularis]